MHGTFGRLRKKKIQLMGTARRWTSVILSVRKEAAQIFVFAEKAFLYESSERANI